MTGEEEPSAPSMDVCGESDLDDGDGPTGGETDGSIDQNHVKESVGGGELVVAAIVRIQHELRALDDRLSFSQEGAGGSESSSRTLSERLRLVGSILDGVAAAAPLAFQDASDASPSLIPTAGAAIVATLSPSPRSCALSRPQSPSRSLSPPPNKRMLPANTFATPPPADRVPLGLAPAASAPSHPPASLGKTNLAPLPPPPPTLRFRDVVGADAAKRALFENVCLPLRLPPRIRAAVFAGVRAGAGATLLHGPPGTGKTRLARAAAGEAHATFIELSPSNVLSRFHGDSEQRLRDAFALARAQQPAVIFFDEVTYFAVISVHHRDVRLFACSTTKHVTAQSCERKQRWWCGDANDDGISI